MAQNPHPFFPWLTAPRRRWIYDVTVALLPILIAVGVLTDTMAALIPALVLALVSTGTAALHTPKENTHG